MNYKKGFIAPLLIIIIALLVLGGGAYVYTQNKQANVSKGPTPPMGPVGILLPSSCRTVGLVGDANHPFGNYHFAEGTWLIDCGSTNNGNARATLGTVLVQQGWKFCDSGLAGASWWKDGVVTGVFEGSSYPGGYLGLSQNDGLSCQ